MRCPYFRLNSALKKFCKDCEGNLIEKDEKYYCKINDELIGAWSEVMSMYQKEFLKGFYGKRLNNIVKKLKDKNGLYSYHRKD